MNSQKQTSRVDYGLVLTLMLFCIISVVSIYGSQQGMSYVFKQAIFYVLGGIIIAGVMRFDSEQLRKMSWYLYGVFVIMLIVLKISPDAIAPPKNGAKSWFVVPFLGSLQPSEFMKIFFILAVSRVAFDHNEKNTYKTLKSDAWLFLKIILTAIPPLFGVMLQPDLGTALVFLAIIVATTFVSGITWKLILPIFGGGSVLATSILALVVYFPNLLVKYLHVKTYQFDRIYTWIDPENNLAGSGAGYQLLQSLLAIGSGGTFGKGFSVSEVSVPERQTDFIFTVIGEHYGFIGGSIVVSLFFILIYQITKIGIETKNNYYSYVCAGIIAMLTFHVLENVGMCIQLLPITGIPLPLISYGGSSLLSTLVGLGLIFSMRFHQKKFMFS